MEYTELLRLVFRVNAKYAVSKLFFGIQVKKFTGSLIVGAIGDLLVALEFLDRFILIRNGYAFGLNDISPG